MPIAIAGILNVYVINVVKYAIDSVGDYTMQTYFNIIYMQGTFWWRFPLHKAKFLLSNFFVNFFETKIVFIAKGRSETLGYTHQCLFLKLV